MPPPPQSVSLVAFRLVRPEGELALAPRTHMARSARERLLGLLVRPPLDAGEGLWLIPSGSIHTLGMRYPIDVVFLDRSLRVLRVARGVRPGRIALAPRGTRSVLELPEGAAAQVSPGDLLRAGPEPARAPGGASG